VLDTLGRMHHAINRTEEAERGIGEMGTEPLLRCFGLLLQTDTGTPQGEWLGKADEKVAAFLCAPSFLAGILTAEEIVSAHTLNNELLEHLTSKEVSHTIRK